MASLLLFWDRMINGITTATNVLVITGGLAGIILIVVFSVTKLSKEKKNFAVILSTILSCILMIPVISSFNYLVKSKIEGAAFEEENSRLALIRAQNRVNLLEKERLENQIAIAKQSIEIEALNDNIKLLQSAQLSMQSFEKILELALLQTNLKQTQVRKEPINQDEFARRGLGLRADYYYDEILVVQTHDINAKFGIDLNRIKISKLDDNSVSVSGIRPKFIGTDRNITDTILKEIRTNNIKNGIVASVDTKYNAQGISQANTYADNFAREFQLRLSSGQELNFIDDAVIQLAQNFIRVMLAPLYSNIKFDDNEGTDALPIAEHLRTEIRNNNDKRSELLDTNESLLMSVLNLEIQAAEIEREH